jgi:hypothetical protein
MTAHNEPEPTLDRGWIAMILGLLGAAAVVVTNVAVPDMWLVVGLSIFFFGGVAARIAYLGGVDVGERREKRRRAAYRPTARRSRQTPD